tara:strand:- start:1036 stop:1401 length:366 start_codon:yes stop_codon:yes gene_type:complete
MELVKEKTNVNLINAWEDKKILVNNEWLENSFIITINKILPNWACHKKQDISIESIKLATEIDTEIILLGTGKATVFIEPEIISFFNDKKIGLEVMDTSSACRTYNLLAHEYRKVSAAIII